MSEKSERLFGIDWLRGVVMVLMALDHARDYFGDLRVNPLDLDQVSTGVFLTRWVTHFCAPVFVLLAGVGAFLYGSRGRSRGEVSRFLWTRGLWLVVLEFTVVHFGWWGTFEGPFLLMQVIAAIGASMILMAAAVWLPHGAIVVLGVGIVALHNLLDPVAPADLGPMSWVWTILHEDGVTSAFQPIPLPGGYQLLVLYALLPWFGVMAVGYGLGPVFLRERASRRKILMGIGVLSIALFLALRATGLHGNFAEWEGAEGLRGVLEFLNCQKYPPSLVYLLMTLGPALVALAILDREPGALGRALVVFGRVPLFYYVLHVFLLQYGSRLFYLVRDGQDVRALPIAFSGQPFPAFYGNPLWMVYLSWIAAIGLLYLPCRWFAGVKQRSRSPWMSYL